MYISGIRTLLLFYCWNLLHSFKLFSDKSLNACHRLAAQYEIYVNGFYIREKYLDSRTAPGVVVLRTWLGIYN